MSEILDCCYAAWCFSSLQPFSVRLRSGAWLHHFMISSLATPLVLWQYPQFHGTWPRPFPPLCLSVEDGVLLVELSISLPKSSILVFSQTFSKSRLSLANWRQRCARAFLRRGTCRCCNISMYCIILCYQWCSWWLQFRSLTISSRWSTTFLNNHPQPICQNHACSSRHKVFVSYFVSIKMQLPLKTTLFISFSIYIH